MSANNKLRFVTKALYCIIAEECALEGAELKGLFEILEDASLEGSGARQEFCGDQDFFDRVRRLTEERVHAAAQTMGALLKEERDGQQ